MNPGEHVCPNHPASTAVGVCMNCGRLVCSECRTRLDGRNVCPECAAELEARGGRWKSAGRIAVLALVGLAVGYWLTRPGELPPEVQRLEEVSGAVESFRDDLGRWPRGLGELIARPEGDGGEGATGEARAGEGMSRWTGPYLGNERYLSQGRPTDVHGNPLEYGVDSRGVWLATAGEDGTWQTDLATIASDQDPGGDDLILWVYIGNGAPD
ncbi:MAG: hypothetical protein NTW26_06400 [bacterium]|nr:hypothetical protein [bacterium]